MLVLVSFIDRDTLMFFGSLYIPSGDSCTAPESLKVKLICHGSFVNLLHPIGKSRAWLLLDHKSTHQSVIDHLFVCSFFFAHGLLELARGAGSPGSGSTWTFPLPSHPSPVTPQGFRDWSHGYTVPPGHGKIAPVGLSRTNIDKQKRTTS